MPHGLALRKLLCHCAAFGINFYEALLDLLQAPRLEVHGFTFIDVPCCTKSGYHSVDRLQIRLSTPGVFLSLLTMKVGAL